MGEENQLEQLIWINGKLLDKENNKVKVEPIGKPKLIRGITSIKDEDFYKNFYESLEHGDEPADAFVRGALLNFSRDVHTEYACPVQLYKIESDE